MFRVVGLKAQINLSCVSGLLFYVYFLLLVRAYWLLFIFYLIGCKIGFGGPCVCVCVCVHA